MRYQRKNYTCGPASLVNAGRALGVRMPKESTLAIEAGASYDLGTDEFGVMSAARANGLTATSHDTYESTVAWAWLTMHLREGRPVICCVMNWKHWVTAVGLLGDRVIYCDPSNVVTNKRENGTIVRSKSEWLKQWKNSREGRYYGIAVGKSGK